MIFFTETVKNNPKILMKPQRTPNNQNTNSQNNLEKEQTPHAS